MVSFPHPFAILKVGPTDKGTMTKGNSVLSNAQHQQLWEALRQGEPQALLDLYLLFYDQLYNYGLRICQDPELTVDCIQELFVELWERHSKLKDVNKLKPYLLRYFRNILYKQNRKRSRETLQVLTEMQEVGTVFSFQEVWIQAEEQHAQHKKLHEAMSRLTERQREVIFLRFYSELSYDEIAKVMDMNYQSVRNIVYRGLQKMRKWMLMLLALSLFFSFL